MSGGRRCQTFYASETRIRLNPASLAAIKFQCGIRRLMRFRQAFSLARKRYTEYDGLHSE
jgi:hypothetical protein